jgi:hypothetical protein
MKPFNRSGSFGDGQMELFTFDYRYNGGMLAPPVIFLAVSIALWRFFNAPFLPEQFANRVLQAMPDWLVGPGDGSFGPLAKQLAMVNFAVLYFGAYFVFTYYWPRMKARLRNPFLGAFLLLLINLIILLPMAGRGLFGYRFPQGAFSVSIFLLASHWVFARSLQWRTTTALRITPPDTGR